MNTNESLMQKRIAFYLMDKTKVVNQYESTMYNLKASILCGTGTIVDSQTARVASEPLVASGSHLASLCETTRSVVTKCLTMTYLADVNLGRKCWPRIATENLTLKILNTRIIEPPKHWPPKFLAGSGIEHFSSAAGKALLGRRREKPVPVP